MTNEENVCEFVTKIKVEPLLYLNMFQCAPKLVTFVHWYGPLSFFFSKILISIGFIDFFFVSLVLSQFLWWNKDHACSSLFFVEYMIYSKTIWLRVFSYFFKKSFFSGFIDILLYDISVVLRVFHTKFGCKLNGPGIL